MRRHYYLLASQALEGWTGAEGRHRRLRPYGRKAAHALGAHVVAFTPSAAKREVAHELGADEFVAAKDPEEMAAHLGSFNFILDIVAVSHNVDMCTKLLKLDGTSVLIGTPEERHPAPSAAKLIYDGDRLADL